MLVEVVYKQTLLTLELAAPCTAQAAIEQSGILTLHPEINLAEQAIGIFGSKITLNTQIKDGDRIEIYRPLLIDPKKARKLRI